MVVMSIYSVVDGLFVSNLIGDLALSAVNVVMPLVMIIGAVGLMLGSGGSALVARTLGEGNSAKANKYFSMIVFSVIVIGIILSAVCLIFLRKILTLMGGSPLIIEDCMSYGYVMVGGSVLFMLQCMFQSFFPVAEKTKLGLILSICAGVANMALDYVFIKFAKLGILGAGIATVIGFAIGGGVVSDLAGFVAGTFGRGVPFINYSTTLLSAADASIGGKTAVDTPLATNLIGLFNQPKKVYIDIEAWKTLPEKQLYSGLAETIKHACLDSRELFDYLNAHMEDILSFDRAACEHIANENCRIKYQVVMKDERESGLREVLNLGHTVGRAIETVSDYRLLHGEAVSIGMVAQVKLANRLGYVSADEENEVMELLKKAHLPVEIPDYINREALVKKLYTDKKVRDGRLRFVLQKGIGAVVEFSEGVFATPIEESVAREIIMSM